MMLQRRSFLHLASGAATLPAVKRIAVAQLYPTRPITLIVPFAPGGLTDVLARVMAEPMRKSLGQTVVIEMSAGPAGTSAPAGLRARGPMATRLTSATGMFTR
jgi:tripartite-type tricarboxylate transporter receptor subunit TctC